MKTIPERLDSLRRSIAEEMEIIGMVPKPVLAERLGITLSTVYLWYRKDWNISFVGQKKILKLEKVFKEAKK